MNPKMRCKMVQGWVFVSNMQKNLSNFFQNCILQWSIPQNTNTSANVQDIIANAGTQVSSLLGCDTILSGKHLVLPSSSGSRSPKTDVYDIRVETGQQVVSPRGGTDIQWGWVCASDQWRGIWNPHTCHHSTVDNANTWCISRGTTACSGHTAASSWTTLHPSHSSSSVALCCCGGSDPMTAPLAVTRVVMTLSELQWPNHNYYNALNLHHKATCSFRPERRRVLVWGRTFCECSLSWPPCSPCPCLACSPSNVCIPNVPLVWSSLLIYEAANGTNTLNVML